MGAGKTKQAKPGKLPVNNQFPQPGPYPQPPMAPQNFNYPNGNYIMPNYPQTFPATCPVIQQAYTPTPRPLMPGYAANTEMRRNSEVRGKPEPEDYTNYLTQVPQMPQMPQMMQQVPPQIPHMIPQMQQFRNY